MRQLTFAASLMGLALLGLFMIAANLLEPGPFDSPSTYEGFGPLRVVARLPAGN